MVHIKNPCVHRWNWNMSESFPTVGYLPLMCEENKANSHFDFEIGPMSRNRSMYLGQRSNSLSKKSTFFCYGVSQLSDILEELHSTKLLA